MIQHETRLELGPNATTAVVTKVVNAKMKELDSRLGLLLVLVPLEADNLSDKVAPNAAKPTGQEVLQKRSIR